MVKKPTPFVSDRAVGRNDSNKSHSDHLVLKQRHCVSGTVPGEGHSIVKHMGGGGGGGGGLARRSEPKTSKYLPKNSNIKKYQNDTPKNFYE